VCSKCAGVPQGLACASGYVRFTGGSYCVEMVVDCRISVLTDTGLLDIL
jgi:hypothetical protein